MSTYDPYTYDTRDTGGGGGKMTNKSKLYIGGGVIGALAIYLWYRKQKNAAAAAASADTSSTDTSSTDSSLDTGYSPALTSYTDPSTGAIISGGGWSTGGYALPGTAYYAPGDNAQWMQQAIPYLTAQGFDAVTTTTALGKYLAGLGLSNTEYEIVQAAIGVEGQPPNPPAPPHVATPSGQSGGTTSSVSSSVTNPQPPSGVHIQSHRKGTAVLAWSPSQGATAYAVFYKNVPIARVAHPTATVHLNGHYSVASLRGAFVSKRTGIDVKGI